MAGKPQFTNIVNISANPSKMVRNIAFTDSEVVGAGLSHDMKFFSPVGFISRVVNLYIIVPKPAGATSGTHTILVQTGGENLINVFSVVANFDQGIIFSSGNNQNPVVSTRPATEQGLIDMMRNQYFDEDDFYTVLYINNTNADNVAAKTIRLNLLQEKISG